MGRCAYPSISIFTADPSNLELGSPTISGPVIEVNFTSSGGALSYTYTGLPGGCTTVDVSALTCTPTASGNFTIRIFLNDSEGSSFTSITPLDVASRAPVLSHGEYEPHRRGYPRDVQFEPVGRTRPIYLCLEFRGRSHNQSRESHSQLYVQPEATWFERG